MELFFFIHNFQVKKIRSILNYKIKFYSHKYENYGNILTIFFRYPDQDLEYWSI